MAGFDPMENCITIASACNRYWRKRHLKPKTVAVEPPRGWKGAQVNQSKKAQEWLLWNEYLLLLLLHAFNMSVMVENS